MKRKKFKKGIAGGMTKVFIEIDLDYSIVDRVRRVVRVDGKEVYREIADSEIHNAFVQHPIRQFELFLLGLEKSKNTENVACNITNNIGFFKKIWLQILRKKF